jgi:hypothetical protein
MRLGISHSWNGTVLTITSDSGTSSADLKGDIGIRGPQGPAGEQYKPQYGLDYFTEAEKGEFLAEIDEHIEANKDGLFMDEVRGYVDQNTVGAEDVEEYVNNYVRENTVNAEYVESYVGANAVNAAYVADYVADNAVNAEDVATYVGANAVSAQTASLANVSVKAWAQSLRGTTYAFTDNTTKDMPTGIAPGESFAIAAATVAASGGWIELKLNYVLTGCVAVAIYNYAWSDWKWENPPMALSQEYKTTEYWNGSSVFTQLIDMGPLTTEYVTKAHSTAMSTIVGIEAIAVSETTRVSFPIAYTANDEEKDLGVFADTTNVTVYNPNLLSTYKVYVTLKYIK